MKYPKISVSPLKHPKNGSVWGLKRPENFHLKRNVEKLDMKFVYDVFAACARVVAACGIGSVALGLVIWVIIPVLKAFGITEDFSATWGGYAILCGAAIEMIALFLLVLSEMFE